MEGALVAAARFVADKVAILVQLDSKLKAMTGIEEKMEKLKEMSTIIDLVIEDVESHPLNKDAVKDLLRKLKYLAYDLEDAVDYYDTKVFQKKQRSNTPFGLVSDFISSDNQVLFNSRVGCMIEAVTDSLDSILLQKSILLNLPQSSSHLPLYPYSETHSLNGFDVIGREPEKNNIVNILTNDDDEGSSHSTLRVIAIVGMGGLGKTTLAQLVFNDEKVQGHFASLTMWKVVGAEFNPTKIMKSILELGTGASVNISEIDLVMQKLKKELSGKRFLLVLDDVWNEDPVKWRILKAALTFGARGSKILVTTRSQQVSSIMDSSYIHQIKQLSPADCLFLFQNFAFGDKEENRTLMEIGAKIVEKCGGVPLAVISLGNTLRSTRDETYWSSVLNSEIMQLRDMEEKVLAVLKWSYDTLPPWSKKCFAFASLYPKNSQMEKDELIKLWIANGFVRSEKSFDAETLGNDVFDDLVRRSFFLLAPSRNFEYDSDETKCTMHDLMHDLARSVSANVYWHSEQDSVEDIGNRTYHLQIYLRGESCMTQVLDKKPVNLRTFMPFDFPYTQLYLSINLLQVISDSELKFLRALDLGDSGISEVPTSIGNLIHLRYLNLRMNYIKILPMSIGNLIHLMYLNLLTNHIEVLPMSIGNLIHLRYLNLYDNKIEVLPDSITLLSNLQYLNLGFNDKLRELPKELGNMQNLRVLDLPNGHFQIDIHMPCGLSRLTNLRSLPVFFAGNRTGACSILELKNLKLHGEMQIKFSKDFKSYSCGGKKILKNKDLNELLIEFNNVERYDKDILDDLCPHTSLKELVIKDYGSSQFPTWLIELQLPNLVEVCLENCRGCEHIPPFGNLQFLKKLVLVAMDVITHLGAEFHGYRSFPSLQELILNRMNNLEEWPDSHNGDDQLFPKLQSLHIFSCPKLNSMPRFPTIQELAISNCNGSLLSCVGRLTSLSVLLLRWLDDMTSLPSGCIKNLTSLTKLEIMQCSQLQCLPGDELQHLEMLRSLTIEQCPNLASFPLEVGRLSSFCSLDLLACPSIILQLEELVQILNSVKKFNIQICGNKVNLRGQLQYLHTLKILSLCGAHLDRKRARFGDSKFLRICCCDELESLMTAEPASSVLEELSIDGIFNLTNLPDWLQHLKSLRSLSIRNCSRLERLPRNLKNLPMLTTLNIANCPLLKSRCERETGEDCPIISHLPYIYNRYGYLML
ncbi:disease resistance protein RGA2-like [Zingiber officinale]|uniref:disease resistance protein RGA2-like n=1 Tax=Zingiber officinale TaxID=94328 RepID=UPI001C4CC5B0|nr:disease resistance protein RGA2-like [Zingiber officinale]